MDLQLKRLPKDGVSSALTKAERYRLLNEPAEAVSICRDVLEIEPDNQQAQVIMVLALADQAGLEAQASSEALRVAAKLDSEYDRQYYAGIVWERRAKSRAAQNLGGSGPYVYECLQEALACYEKAETLAEPGNIDPILRWNTCARYLAAHPNLAPEKEDRSAVTLE